MVGRDGLPAASLGAIAREAGTSKPAVLYHFQSRQNLIHAVAARVLDLHDGIMREARAMPEPGKRIDHVIDIMFSLAGRPYQSALYELMKIGHRDPEVAELVRRNFARITDAVVPLVPAGCPEPQTVAADVVHSVLGYMHLFICSGSEDVAPYRDGAKRVIVALFRDGH